RHVAMVCATVYENAGGGAASDSTFILRAMLERGIRDAAIGMFWDPMTVRLAMEAGEGASFDIRLGGKLGPASGLPVDVHAKVLKVGEDVKFKFGGARKSIGTIGD